MNKPGQINWLNALLVFLLLLTLGVASTAATAASPGSAKDFDHLRTGFALSGTHNNIACESCHIGGLFKGTPRDCESCHTSGSRFAKSNTVKPGEHIPSSLSCDSCHSTRSFASVRMDHRGVVTGTCQTCHNGKQATGKTADHLSTTAACDSCHRSSAWRPASGFKHAGVVTGTCATCHNGQRATGKPSAHTPYQNVAGLATVACDSCHKAGFASWTPARLHANATVISQCASCHAAAKPATAVHSGQTTCENCHKSTSSWSGAKVDHASFTVATNCSSCHNGSAATGKAANHMPVAATNCVSCHSSSSWKPAKWSHTQVTVANQCSSCHSGAFPPASGKPANHLPYQSITGLAAANCDSCHKAGFASWTPARLHASVSVSAQCASCHAAVKPATAVHSGQTTCENCHKSTSSWSGAKVDHGTFTVATNCSSCHNGSAATGKAANHMPTAATNCIACHSTAIWKPAKWNHTQIPVLDCASCHNGAYSPADGKPAQHIPYQVLTGAVITNCSSCHKAGYASWANGRFHSNVSVVGQCKTCHAGSYVSQGAVAKPSNHIPESQLLAGASMECNGCHISTTAWTQKMNHNGSMGSGAGWCKSCHVSGTNFLGNMEKKALTHRTKTPVPADCSTSGCHRPLGKEGAAYTKWD